MDWHTLIEPMGCWLMRTLSAAETQAGLGGWVGAIGALPAIWLTWRIARAQTRSDRRARRSQREQYVDLISGIVTDFERVLEPFLTEARNGYSDKAA